MKDFLIRSFCLAAVILILAGYNQVLKDRSKDEEITKLEAQVTKLQQEKETLKSYEGITAEIQRIEHEMRLITEKMDTLKNQRDRSRALEEHIRTADGKAGQKVLAE